MIEKTVEIATAAGRMDSFVCRPEGQAPFPAIIFYMDAPGIREELRDMARRIAAAGYYVVLPNLYYRHGAEGMLTEAATDPKSAEFQKMFRLMESLSNALVVEDTRAILTWLDGESAARAERIGTVGYCMSGPFVVAAAARLPARIACAASIHGVALVTDRADSPHRLGADITAELYFAWAERDRFAPQSDIAKLRTALDAAGTSFEIELYPGTEHGFAFPQRYSFNIAAAERHWERLFALFARTLR